MKRYLHALELGVKGDLPERVDSSSDPSASVIRELVGAGYLEAIDASSFDGPAYLGPKITLAGREYLESLRAELLAKQNRRQGAETEPRDPAPAAVGGSGVWAEIETEYGISKRVLAKRISFVNGEFKRKVIFRDIEQAFVLAQNGFSKPAVILAGGVIEELLRLYLEYKGVPPESNTLDSYIRACRTEGFMKDAIHGLADSVRQFRNIVHLERETSARHTISKATAKGAVASVFTIANDLRR